MQLGGWVVMLVSFILFLFLIGLPTGLNDMVSGLGIGTDDNGVIDSDIESSSLWSEVFGVTGILVVLGASGLIIIGLFGKGYDPSLVYVPFIIYIGGLFIRTFTTIVTFVHGFNQVWLTSIVALIFTAMGFGFAMSCLNYFGGRQ